MKWQNWLQADRQKILSVSWTQSKIDLDVFIQDISIHSNVMLSL